MDGKNTKFLFVSSAPRGSFTIRGQQIAEEIGAKWGTKPTSEALAKAKVVIIVKHLDPITATQLRGKKTVLDVVDGWPKPIANQWSRSQCINWLRQHLIKYQPTGVVAATKQMAQELKGLHPKVLWLPHHGRPKQSLNPIKQHVKIIGYEGSAPYIRDWVYQINTECDKRKWEFVINPGSLHQVDIVLALRGGVHKGWISNNWKSNVKLANAQITGTPFIGLPEAGYLECASGGEVWVNTPIDLKKAFDLLTDYDERHKRAKILLSKAIHLEQISETYVKWLEEL